MKFYQSLFILTYSYDNICYLSEIMLDHNLTFLNPQAVEDKEAFHFMALFKHSIMEACSFLEEYHQFYALAEIEFKERILFVKTAAKPVLKKINEWKDLKDVRNELIAHPWRTKKDNTFSYTKVFSYNAPRDYIELQLLKTYLSMIIGLIEAEFKEELAFIPQYMESIKPVAVPPRNNPEVFNEMVEVIKQVNTVCTANKKWYILDEKKIIGREQN